MFSYSSTRNSIPYKGLSHVLDSALAISASVSKAGFGPTRGLGKVMTSGRAPSGAGLDIDNPCFRPDIAVGDDIPICTASVARPTLPIYV